MRIIFSMLFFLCITSQALSLAPSLKKEEVFIAVDKTIENIYSYEKQNVLRKQALKKNDCKAMIKNSIDRTRNLDIYALLKTMVSIYSFENLRKIFGRFEGKPYGSLVLEQIFIRLSWLYNDFNFLGIDDKKIEAVLDNYRGTKLDFRRLEDLSLKNPPLIEEGIPSVLEVKNSDSFKLVIDSRMRIDKNKGLQCINRETGLFGYIDKEGQFYENPNDVLQLMKTTEEHAQFIEQQEKRLILADINYDNVVIDAHYVSFLDGEVYFPVSSSFNELNFFENKQYNSLVFWLDGKISMEDIMFRDVVYSEDKNSYVGKLILNKEEVTDKVKFTVYGEKFLKDGKKLNVPDLLRDIVFHDLRHIFKPICLGRKEGDDSLLGVTSKELIGGQLFYGVNILEGDPLLAADAYVKPVEIPLLFKVKDGEKSFLSNILEDRGYEKVLNEEDIKKEGQYCVIRESTLEEPGIIKIFFEKAIYPQEVIGVAKDGNIKVVYFPGASGRRGVTLAEAQNICLDLGMKDALFLVNGGSVHIEIGRKTNIPYAQRLGGCANIFIMSDVSIEDLSDLEVQALYRKFELNRYEEEMINRAS